MVRFSPGQIEGYLERNPKQRGALVAQLGFDFDSAEGVPITAPGKASAQAKGEPKASPVDNPLERAEARALMLRVRRYEALYPELLLFHHIPNGGKRDRGTAQELWRAGVRAGIPDYFLPVARQGYHGLYIELKRVKGSYTSDGQDLVIPRLKEQGYRVEVCRGHLAAIAVLEWYLGMKMPLSMVPQ